LAGVGIGIAKVLATMAETDQDQKTEQATEKKLQDAHERGQFAKSPELLILFTLAAAVGMMAST
jgi:flagellar biosynthetic protein FlhB